MNKAYKPIYQQNRPRFDKCKTSINNLAIVSSIIAYAIFSPVKPVLAESMTASPIAQITGVENEAGYNLQNNGFLDWIFHVAGTDLGIPLVYYDFNTGQYAARFFFGDTFGDDPFGNRGCRRSNVMATSPDLYAFNGIDFNLYDYGTDDLCSDNQQTQFGLAAREIIPPRPHINDIYGTYFTSGWQDQTGYEIAAVTHLQNQDFGDQILDSSEGRGNRLYVSADAWNTYYPSSYDFAGDPKTANFEAVTVTMSDGQWVPQSGYYYFFGFKVNRKGPVNVMRLPINQNLELYQMWNPSDPIPDNLELLTNCSSPAWRKVSAIGSCSAKDLLEGQLGGEVSVVYHPVHQRYMMLYTTIDPQTLDSAVYLRWSDSNNVESWGETQKLINCPLCGNRANCYAAGFMPVYPYTYAEYFRTGEVVFYFLMSRMTPWGGARFNKCGPFYSCELEGIFTWGCHEVYNVFLWELRAS